MTSLFDELSEKLQRDPRLTKKGGPRVDLSLLLFNARDQVRALWLAADEQRRAQKGTPALDAAVEALRPIFGSRGAPT